MSRCEDLNKIDESHSHQSSNANSDKERTDNVGGEEGAESQQQSRQDRWNRSRRATLGKKGTKKDSSKLFRFNPLEDVLEEEKKGEDGTPCNMNKAEEEEEVNLRLSTPPKNYSEL